MSKIGKSVGNCLYIHISAIFSLKASEANLVAECEKHLPEAFNYAIVKICISEQYVCFITCPDFDKVNEPIVGDSAKVSLITEKVTITKSKGQVYHHRHLFVMNDYKGFDIQQSIHRSEMLTSIIPWKTVSTKIGYAKFWNEILEEYKIEK